MKNEEIFKKIDETINKVYYVSNLGNCKTVDKQTGAERITKGIYNRHTGYYSFVGKYVHRLVADNFLRPAKIMEQVNHRDSVRTNNQVDNLEYISRKANNATEHARELKSLHHQSVRHEDEVVKAVDGNGQVKYYKDGKSCARHLGCSHPLVYNAIAQRGSCRRCRGNTLSWVKIADLPDGTRFEA